MKNTFFLQCLAVTAALTLTACSSSDNDAGSDTENGINSDTSEDIDNGITGNDSSDGDETITQGELDDDAPEAANTGEPGGDISAIAGLWDGTTTTDETNDVIYWNLASNGVLTRYDYQQDGVASANGDNCYIIGDPITVTPEEDNAYSIFNVGVTAERNDDSLTIVFIDEDKNDVDVNGDTTETPTFTWTLLTTPTLADLNACTTISPSPITAEDPVIPAVEPEPAAQQEGEVGSEPLSGGESGDFLEPPADIPANRDRMTGAECISEGGVVIGDIGDGAIHRPEYRCESGLKPIANIYSLEGEPIATEGAVCCK